MSAEQRSDSGSDSVVVGRIFELSEEAEFTIRQIQDLASGRHTTAGEVLSNALSLYLKAAQTVNAGNEVLITTSTGYEKLHTPGL